MNDTRAHVALVRCETYDQAAVYEAVGRGLSLLGGAQQFVCPGEKILLKPNLLVGIAPDRPANTHPAVFEAVIRHLQAVGADLRYGDCPGFGPPAGAARRAGLAAVAKELDVPLANFSDGQIVSFPAGNLIKQFTIAQGVLESDGLVSLPRIKTHGLTRLTGAVKNQFGCIPGLLKGEFHARLPDAERFCQMLVDLNRLLRPRLYVMDGIVAMEGNGPRNGDPRPLSVLLFSTDPVALDATACRIIDLDPELVLTNVWGEAWELGSANRVELLGDPLDAFVTPDFVVDRQRRPIAPGKRSALRKAMQNWVIPRPVVVPEGCTRCGTCVRVCPVTPKAIAFPSDNGRQEPPIHDYRLCIRCYCCQEMCPENAIHIETPLLGRLIHREERA
ncbi:MAG: DUF362 domain-containing protein [Anaerolineae bacterium]|nr:DUF362 domain-containing protein [Anaerolineae bacterium]